MSTEFVAATQRAVSVATRIVTGSAATGISNAVKILCLTAPDHPSAQGTKAYARKPRPRRRGAPHPVFASSRRRDSRFSCYDISRPMAEQSKQSRLQALRVEVSGASVVCSAYKSGNHKLIRCSPTMGQNSEVATPLYWSAIPPQEVDCQQPQGVNSLPLLRRGALELCRWSVCGHYPAELLSHA